MLLDSLTKLLPFLKKVLRSPRNFAFTWKSFMFLAKVLRAPEKLCIHVEIFLCFLEKVLQQKSNSFPHIICSTNVLQLNKSFAIKKQKIKIQLKYNFS